MQVIIKGRQIHGEAVPRDTVGGIQGRHEGGAFARVELEKAKEGRVAVVAEAEAAGEAVVGGEAAPALGDEGGAWERGRLRGEAEEDLLEEIVVIQRRLHRRRQRAAARVRAAHRIGKIRF